MKTRQYRNRAGFAVRLAFAMCLGLLATSPLSAQSISIGVTPGVAIPMFGSEDSFSLGARARLDVDWHLPGLPLVLNGGFEYAGVAIPDLSGNLSIVGASLGGGLFFRPIEKLDLRVVASGGYYLGFYDGDSGGSAFIRADAGASWRFLPAISLGLSAGYSNYLSSPKPFLQTLDATLAITIRPSPEKHTPKLEMPKVELAPLFPVFRTYFDAHPFGRISLRNGEAGSIKNVRVTFFMKGYMDAPKTCVELDSMKAGESRDVDVYALLNESILGITEETKVQGTVTVTYLYNGENVVLERTETVKVYDRNAMTWEDDRRAAAFVTSKDPTVLRLAKAINSAVRDNPSPAASLDFRLAMGLFEELGLYGLRYTVSPTGSYAEASVNKFAVDFLQFPRQTLEYKGGDCSDLSILYAALLESLGIETAFITVPGHIFLAFAPGMSPDEAASTFSHAEDLIVIDNKVWVPVEITLVKDGFLAAWKEAGREWRENAATRAFYPLREAWATYGPVGLPGEALDLGKLGGTDFRKRFDNSMRSFAEREVASREVALKAEVTRTRSSPAALNKLGVLYARFGLFDKAQAQFEAAAQAGGKAAAAAHVNLGNIYFLGKDWEKARDEYAAAAKADASSWSALLGLAKVDYERENYGTAKDYYNKAVALRPDLSSKYAFLAGKTDETSRAAAADDRAAVEWSDK
jgi:hypothetical protein